MSLPPSSNDRRARRHSRRKSYSGRDDWDEVDGFHSAHEGPDRRSETGRQKQIRFANDPTSGDDSDDSLDDDELYDQLLRKFTGRGLHERETGGKDPDERVEGGDDGEGHGVGSENRNRDSNVSVDAGYTDNIADGDGGDGGDGGDEAIEREDNSFKDIP